MSDLTIEVYEKAVELAKTDSFLSEGLKILERLNIASDSAHRTWEAARDKYDKQEQSIFEYIKEHGK